MRCSYECSWCDNSGECWACNPGFYLKGVDCVLANSCGATYIANAET